MHIPDNLEVRVLEEVAPGLPVILSEGVLDGDNGVLGGELLVLVGKLLVGDPLLGVGVGVLEVEVVLLGVGLVELGRGNVHGDVHPALVTGDLDGLGDELESLLGGLNVRGNSTLVTDVAGRLAVLLLGKSLELLVALGTPAHGLGEGRSVRWDNHELLEGETATGVGTTVQDVHERNGKNVRLLGAGKVRDVSVERDTLLSGGSLGDGHGDTEDGVGTKLGLVLGTVELVEEAVNSRLVLDVEVLLDQSRGNDGVDVVNSLGDTLSAPLGLVAISGILLSPAIAFYCGWEGSPKLAGLVRAGGGTGGDDGAVKTGLGDLRWLSVLVAWQDIHVKKLTMSTSTVGLPRES